MGAAMLRELAIRNLAVVEEARVVFGPGLNVLTGETGAGKSIVIDALLLVRGARAQPDLIRTGAESASVEAIFEVSSTGPLAVARPMASSSSSGSSRAPAGTASSSTILRLPWDCSNAWEISWWRFTASTN